VATPELDRAPALTVARAGFGAVVLAAGVSGLALVIMPESTGQFFSWGLGPPPLAGLVGGLYLASAVTFAVALRLPWRCARSLVAASVALTAPTLVATFIHLEVFDFGRWQAWAWVGLFLAAPPFWAAMLVINRSAAPRSAPPDVGRPAAIALLVLAALLVVATVVVWTDPSVGGRALPFELSPLGGRFIAAWLAFLAVLAGWAALRPAEARLPFVALAAYPAGALVAGLRSLADLSPPGARRAYLCVLGLAAAGFGAALVRSPTCRPALAEREPTA
jgi:hypothetical protein